MKRGVNYGYIFNELSDDDNEYKMRSDYLTLRPTFIINTARSYYDLTPVQLKIGLFEDKSGVLDIINNLASIIVNRPLNVEITTLSPIVIERVCYLISTGQLSNYSAEVRIFESGKLAKVAKYDKNGNLIGFPDGFFNVN